MPPRLFHDKRILLLVAGTVLVATVVFATAVRGRSQLLDRPPVAEDSTTSSAHAPGTTGATAPDPPTTARPSPITRVIQWMNEHGPTSGGGWGPGDTAYYMLMEGDCAGVLRMAEGKGDEPLSGRTGTLFGGAASACLAAFHGRAELWPRADVALERMARHAPTLDCEFRAVYELLKRLVEAHRAEPSARMVKQTVGRRPLACPRFTKITPNHGPAEGGYTVRVEGENLPPVVGVNFLEAGVNHHSKAELQDGRYVVVTVPRAVDPDIPASVRPDGARPWTEAGVEFRYDPPAATSGSTTTTTTTTTTTRPPSTTTSTTTAPSSTSS